jgi:hypothetical protein
MESQDELVELLQRLSQQILRTGPSRDATVNVCRLLRPTNPEVMTHSDAVKTRIRRFILSKYGDNSDGPSAVADFDREIDSLRRMQSPNWQAFLAILEPLSLHMSQQTRPDHKNFAFPAFNVKIDKSDSEKTPLGGDGAAPVPLNEPGRLSTVDFDLINHKALWVSPQTEMILLRDLLLIFQV